MEITNRTDIFGRRDFIRIGSLGSLGLTLAGALRANARKDISVILVWQSGGCGHQDTFDMKPDAPIEYRGEFKPIPTNVPGIQICEHLPYTAKQADKFTILRSMKSRENNHERAINYLLTGYLPLPTIEFPSMGSVVSKELGPKNGLPPYVAVPNTFPSYGGGFLGADYNPFLAGDANVAGYQVRDLKLPVDVDWSRVNNRRRLVQQMDAKFRAIEASPEFAAMDAFQQRAYELLSSPVAKKAFDVESEDPKLRERYGRTPVGQGCLLARRLVESGVRFVTVAKGWLNYDTHGNNFETMKKVLLPEFDRGFAALLEDLDARGLLATTLVIAMGEFGRTPLVNKAAGRDHHAKAWSIALAGAGIPGGRVLGATDKTATEVTDLPVSPEDLLFTIHTILGIDPAKEYHTPIGRPVKIVNGGKMIKGLLG
ncbi:MAG: DUF1501 domain-containing protein [Acidobacteria bacterium]|nr:DUF1501 domain-containing protein [Acidobacteriota bacterium]MBI3279569.1 DUF1501 domain-containing protein [Acidobacteriota bacterium]